MQKLWRTQHAIIIWLVKAILLCSRFLEFSNALSVCLMHTPLIPKLVKVLCWNWFPQGHSFSRETALATMWRVDRHCLPIKGVLFPFLQRLQLAREGFHCLLFSYTMSCFSVLLNCACSLENQQQHPQLGPQHHVAAGSWNGLVHLLWEVIFLCVFHQ